MPAIDTSGPAPKLDISKEQLDEIAALGLRLAQRDLPKVARAEHLRPYEALPEDTRANMRAGAYRILQALVMLGWIEAP